MGRDTSALAMNSSNASIHPVTAARSGIVVGYLSGNPGGARLRSRSAMHLAVAQDPRMRPVLLLIVAATAVIARQEPVRPAATEAACQIIRFAVGDHATDLLSRTVSPSPPAVPDTTAAYYRRWRERAFRVLRDSSPEMSRAVRAAWEPHELHPCASILAPIVLADGRPPSYSVVSYPLVARDSLTAIVVVGHHSERAQIGGADLLTLVRHRDRWIVRSREVFLIE